MEEPGNVSAYLFSLIGCRVLSESDRLSHELVEQGQRCPRGDRIGAGHQHTDGTPFARLRDEFLPQTRLALTRRSGDEHGARDRVGDALVQRQLERREFFVAPDEWRRPAHQEPGCLELAPFTDENPHFTLAPDFETGVEQAGRERIDDYPFS